jgi:hypothetical protein
MQVQVPARAEEACQIYDPTTKLIILRRSPKTSLWDSCGRYCIQKEKEKKNDDLYIAFFLMILPVREERGRLPGVLLERPSRSPSSCGKWVN